MSQRLSKKLNLELSASKNKYYMISDLMYSLRVMQLVHMQIRMTTGSTDQAKPFSPPLFSYLFSSNA